MLYRKILAQIEAYLKSPEGRVLIVDGARQVGKTYIIRKAGKSLYKNFVEINMEEDALGGRNFADVRTKEDFYLALSVIAGGKLGNKRDTLVFIDEIQRYGELLTLLKFLNDDGRFTYIASGSLLGVTLKLTPSVPIGSVEILHMYPLDFEEFLIANGVGKEAIAIMRSKFENHESLPDSIHARMMDLFRKYLLAGGMPDAVNAFVSDYNIVKMRRIQRQIKDLYEIDAARYESTGRRLKIMRMYQMIPSNLENRKKRVVAKDVEGMKGRRMTDYQDEFDYLISSGIAIEVKAVSKPSFPLVQNSGKNLLKLYMNDVGIFTGLLYDNNILPVLNDERSINLGAVYEAVVAQELRTHDKTLFYYDSKKQGEVDFLIDDRENMSILPIEVKSGRDYSIHSALGNLLKMREYNIPRAFVLSNEQRVREKDGVTYFPVYYVMFI